MIVTPEILRTVVEPVRFPLYSALEHGYAAYSDYADEQALDDPHLRSHLIRYHTKKKLVASWKDELPWAIERKVANSGIHLVFSDGTRMRVMAAAPDSVPPPGHSRSRRAFWRNDYYSPQLWAEDTGWDPMNLLLLWSADPDGMMHLRVAHPINEWKWEATPRCSAVASLQNPLHEEMAFRPETEEDTPLVQIDENDIENEHGETGA